MSNAIIRYVIAFGGIFAVAWSVHFASRAGRPPASPHQEQDRMHVAVPKPDLEASPLASVVEPASHNPVSVGTPFVLVATVTSPRSVSDLRYQWNLPSGTSFVSGDARGTTSVAPGHPFVSRITVVQKEPGAKQFNFGLSVGGIGTTAQYTSSVEAAASARRSAKKDSAPRVR